MSSATATRQRQPAILAPTPKPPPLSPAKLAANRANSLKSTGPTSPEGKRIVSQNATTHGFAAARPPREVLLIDPDLALLHTEFEKEFRPVTPAMHDYHRIVHQLTLLRKQAAQFHHDDLEEIRQETIYRERQQRTARLRGVTTPPPDEHRDDISQPEPSQQQTAPLPQHVILSEAKDPAANDHACASADPTPPTPAKPCQNPPIPATPQAPAQIKPTAPPPQNLPPAPNPHHPTPQTLTTQPPLSCPFPHLPLTYSDPLREPG